jgi:hypothetical protein
MHKFIIIRVYFRFFHRKTIRKPNFRKKKTKKKSKKKPKKNKNKPRRKPKKHTQNSEFRRFLSFKTHFLCNKHQKKHQFSYEKMHFTP